MSFKRTSARTLKHYRAHLALPLVLACASSISGQGVRRVVVESAPFPNAPVELTGVEVAGESHTFTEGDARQFVATFDAPADWLRRIAFKLKNRTDKTLVSAIMYGSVGTGQAGEVPLGIRVLFGQELDESGFTGTAPQGEARRLAPGETAEARWSEAELAGIEKVLSAKYPLTDYKKVRVEVREARFDDGTVWALGRLFRIDQLDPRKWTPLDNAPTSFGAPPSGMKAGERIVEVAAHKPASGPDVLVVGEIKVAGQTVMPGRPFAAGEDWLRDLTVRVKNISTQPITYVQLNFNLPEASYHAGGLGFILCYGKNTVATERPAPDAKRLLPGEEAELSFTAEDYERNRSFTQRLSGLVSFSRLRLGTASIVFADGTRAFVPSPAGTPKSGTP